MEEYSKKIFSERLRYARDQLRHLTQEQLATKCKLPSTSISHFENKDSPRKPSFDNLRRLANALEVTTDYLLGLSDDYVSIGVNDKLYRDVQNLSDHDKEFAQAMINKMLEKK